MLSKIVADNILNYSLSFFREIRLVISCESSAWQMIHMKCQALFFSEKYKKIKMPPAAVVFSPLRVQKNRKVSSV